MPRLRIDFPDPDGTGPVRFSDPVREIRADAAEDVVPGLDAVAEGVAGGLHAAGFMAYEAAPGLDGAMRVRGRESGAALSRPSADAGGSAGGGSDGLPLLWFGLFRAPERSGPAETNGVPTEADDTIGTAGNVPDSVPPDGWTLELDRAQHAAAVSAIRDAIAEGRTYQVNLTTRLRAPFTGSAEALYHGLRRAQGGGYHAFLDLGRHIIVSASPELFFETRGRAITTRPMKGTRPRGRWPEEDRALRDELEASPKDRAENLMIADLLRNDLGRVCVPGGVRVPALREVERYRTVWQMTSTVTGTLRSDVGLTELFRALFPCGSVTGAPKISTMELIAGLEPSPRGVYCGAIGWVRPGGDAVFSVPIRTAVVDREAGEIVYGTGGGVVWDSTPEEEWNELVAKTAVVRNPWPNFRLLETIGVRDGEPVRLDRHVARMARAAERFDFVLDEDDVRTAVLRAARNAPGVRMLRVTAGPAGSIDVEERPVPGAMGTDTTPGARPPTGLPVVQLARDPIDPSDPFLYHKTTHRAVYRRHRDAAPDRLFDVLLWNPDGRVTEFCRGNLVVELDGRRLTPARDAGLLPGCFREELLETGQVAEANLTPDDVERAARLWFINSARGWIEVRLEAD